MAKHITNETIPYYNRDSDSTVTTTVAPTWNLTLAIISIRCIPEAYGLSYSPMGLANQSHPFTVRLSFVSHMFMFRWSYTMPGTIAAYETRFAEKGMPPETTRTGV